MSELQLIHGDNVAEMAKLEPGYHLIYADPPFFTGKQHKNTKTGAVCFDDTWPSFDEYIESVMSVVKHAHRLLDARGSFVLHVDPKTSHYLKVECDKVFGRKCFASEIVWRYRRWPSKTRNFQRVHDVLLRYVKDASAENRWSQLYEPLSGATLKAHGTRKQHHVRVDGRVRAAGYEDVDSPGVPMGDVWDISILAPTAKERTGYPTQKPEKLLGRLVEALTYPGDMVLDPYCGSGTTLSVCQKLGRSAVGIDKGDEAIATATARLAP